MPDSQRHPFCPITNEENLHSALDYVAEKSLQLARAILESDQDLDTICFFAQTQEEYEYIKSQVLLHGPVSKLSHEPTLYADTNFFVKGQRIRIFGVRQPDPERTEIGYGDFPVNDYQHYIESVQNNPYMKQITSGLSKPLIELRHPSLDVLGYIVPAADHNIN
jgi:hypothetical protein